MEGGRGEPLMLLLHWCWGNVSKLLYRKEMHKKTKYKGVIKLAHKNIKTA
jgi:hypothetical protein